MNLSLKDASRSVQRTSVAAVVDREYAEEIRRARASQRVEELQDAILGACLTGVAWAAIGLGALVVIGQAVLAAMGRGL